MGTNPVGSFVTALIYTHILKGVPRPVIIKLNPNHQRMFSGFKFFVFVNAVARHEDGHEIYCHPVAGGQLANPSSRTHSMNSLFCLRRCYGEGYHNIINHWVVVFVG
jgi:hypothetical protein